MTGSVVGGLKSGVRWVLEGIKDVARPVPERLTRLTTKKHAKGATGEVAEGGRQASCSRDIATTSSGVHPRTGIPEGRGGKDACCGQDVRGDRLRLSQMRVTLASNTKTSRPQRSGPKSMSGTGGFTEGDQLGPTVDLLRKRGYSWDQIIEKATSPGGSDLGLGKPK